MLLQFQFDISLVATRSPVFHYSRTFVGPNMNPRRMMARYGSRQGPSREALCEWEQLPGISCNGALIMHVVS
jgi:hypothetical protein